MAIQYLQNLLLDDALVYKTRAIAVSETLASIARRIALSKAIALRIHGAHKGREIGLAEFIV